MAKADRRRRLMWWSLLLLILLLLLINFIDWVFYLTIRETFDDELGDRLVTIANIAGLLVNGNIVAEFKPGDETKSEYHNLQSQLIKIKQLNGLRDIFVINQKLLTMVDANTTVPIGYANRLLEVDASEIESAWNGEPQSSVLYSISGNYYKRGYAPIRDNTNRIVAVLGIEAGAHFSKTINRIRNSLVLVGLISLVLIIATLTTMNRLYATLWRMEKQILSAEKFRAVGQLASGVAHEIRNPLSIIRGTAELLRDELNNKEKAPQLVNDIVSEVDRMNLIVTNFLDMAKSAPVQTTEQNINAILEKTLQLCQHQLNQTNIVCQKEFAENIPAIKIDGQQMTQVFLNLILNAKEAMLTGGTLTLRTRVERNKIIAEIQDTGSGMSFAQQQHLFEPFYSTKPKGVGLGLTISKRIIEEHHGRIDIESELNKGTTVTIRLPIP